MASRPFDEAEGSVHEIRIASTATNLNGTAWHIPEPLPVRRLHLRWCVCTDPTANTWLQHGAWGSRRVLQSLQ